MHDESPSSTGSAQPAPDFVAPPTGPAYYEARRTQWLTPKGTINSSTCQPSDLILAQQKRLESLVNDPKKLHSEAGWREGVRSVWQGLNGGRRLQYRLPLSTVVKVTQAAWVRDKTWPSPGAPPPEEKDKGFM